MLHQDSNNRRFADLPERSGRTEALLLVLSYLEGLAQQQQDHLLCFGGQHLTRLFGVCAGQGEGTLSDGGHGVSHGPVGGGLLGGERLLPLGSEVEGGWVRAQLVVLALHFHVEVGV